MAKVVGATSNENCSDVKLVSLDQVLLSACVSVALLPFSAKCCTNLSVKHQGAITVNLLECPRKAGSEDHSNNSLHGVLDIYRRTVTFRTGRRHLVQVLSLIHI